jgi:hypothetical protein
MNKTQSLKSAAVDAMVFLFWILTYAVVLLLAGGE